MSNQSDIKETSSATTPHVISSSSQNGDGDNATNFFAAAHRQINVRRVLLRVKKGPDEGMQVQISRPRVTIGRSVVNDLVLSDTSVSGTHLEILLGGKGGVIVRDLGSTNGTTVNGVRVKEAWIEVGNSIALGKTEVLFLSTDEIAVPISETNHFGAMWGESESMREVFATLEKIANTSMSVQICGETGTGKELVARALHDHSQRAKAPFVVLDCGAIPRDLAEAKVFGHRRGSFTGATGDRAGAFEEADGGTLFLDEIGELPLDLQPKLLRALDRSEVQRIGENQLRKVDVRVICATHRDLRQMVGQGKFREDLYFRLSVIMVELPPLRERGNDVSLLANKILQDFNIKNAQKLTLTPEAQEALLKESWPGNVRQLKNTIERAAFLSNDHTIDTSNLHLGRPNKNPIGNSDNSAELKQLEDSLFTQPFKPAKQALIDRFEREYCSRLIANSRGNLSHAANTAGITRFYLRELLKRLGLHNVPYSKKSTDNPDR